MEGEMETVVTALRGAAESVLAVKSEEGKGEGEKGSEGVVSSLQPLLASISTTW